MGGCHVELVLDVPEPRPPLRGWFEPILVRAASLMGLDEGMISVVIVDRGRMAQLNQRYKAAVGATDVLSFDLRDDSSEPIDVDMALCLDEASREGAARGHPVRHELLLYAVHGLLHVLGFADDLPAEAGRMHRREDELLTALGIGRVYGAGGSFPSGADENGACLADPGLGCFDNPDGTENRVLRLEL